MCQMAGEHASPCYARAQQGNVDSDNGRNECVDDDILLRHNGAKCRKRRRRQASVCESAKGPRSVCKQMKMKVDAVMWCVCTAVNNSYR